MGKQSREKRERRDRGETRAVRERAERRARAEQLARDERLARDGYARDGRGAAMTGETDAVGGGYAPAAEIRRRYAGLRPDEHLIFYIGPREEIAATAGRVSDSMAAKARTADVVVTDERSTGLPQSALLFRWLEQYDPATEYVTIQADRGFSVVARVPYRARPADDQAAADD